jgi:excisionase family DNA binding protein
VAELLDLDQSRVRQLILDGTLPAEKVGPIWLVRREDVEAARANVRIYRKRMKD